jgi:hypothetical protein
MFIKEERAPGEPSCLDEHERREKCDVLYYGTKIRDFFDIRKSGKIIIK